MLEISRALEIKKFIFISSGAVYERSKESKNGFNEKDKINTLLTYPTSKFFGEKLCDIFNETYNLPVVKIRLFNLYGPRQDYSRKHPAFLAQVLKHLIQDKRLKIYNKNNNIKRDYLYIDDLLRLIYKLLNYKTKNNNLLINACSGDRYSTLDMIKQVEKVAKKKLKIDIDTDPSKFWNKYKNLYQGKYNIKSEIIRNEVFKSAEGDATLLKKIIGKNMTTINKGLRECLRYANEKLK